MHKIMRMTFSISTLLLSILLSYSSPLLGQSQTVPTFSINAVRLDVNKTSTIEGELLFGSVEAAAIGFRIEHDVGFIHILSIEIEGFQAYGNPDNTAGVFDIYAYKNPGYSTVEPTVTKLYLLVATQNEEPSQDVSLQLALRNPYIYPVGGNLPGPITQIAITNSSVIIEDIPDEVCQSSEAVYRVASSTINVRSAPGITGQILRTAYLDETFRVLEQTNSAGGWLRIDLADEGFQQAWVFSGNLTLVCPGAIPTAISVPQLPLSNATSTPPNPQIPPPPNNNGNVLPPPDNGGGNPNPPPQASNTPQLPPTSAPADSDGDGVPDATDRCPTQPPREWQGGGDCPDTDADGVVDPDDACSTQYGTSNGCPDSEGDGVPDSVDRCRDAAGPADNQGCPIGQ